MLKETVLRLLTAHRLTDDASRPAVVSRAQLLTLLRASVGPGHLSCIPELPDALGSALETLLAQGDLVHNGATSYAMAPPMALYDAGEPGRVVFRGDRAYLDLARRALDSPVSDVDPLWFRPAQTTTTWIERRLAEVGVRAISYDHAVSLLPPPRPPRPEELRVQADLDPFVSKHAFSQVERYAPAVATPQNDRWEPVSRAAVQDGDLLRAAGRHFWRHAGALFELDRDAATLAMFYEDRRRQVPLQLAWDAGPGRLQLQRTFLPQAYYVRLSPLWRLDGVRTFVVPDPANRPLVAAALTHLGCELV